MRPFAGDLTCLGLVAWMQRPSERWGPSSARSRLWTACQALRVRHLVPSLLAPSVPGRCPVGSRGSRLGSSGEPSVTEAGGLARFESSSRCSARHRLAAGGWAGAASRWLRKPAGPMSKYPEVLQPPGLGPASSREAESPRARFWEIRFISSLMNVYKPKSVCLAFPARLPRGCHRQEQSWPQCPAC